MSNPWCRRHHFWMDGPLQIAAALILFSFAIGCSRSNSSESVKFQQYYVEGEQLYITHCSNCHQKSGKGLGLLYPPLDHSDYLERNFDLVICQMKYGQKGEMIVNGKSYNQPMPGVRSLTELEIAEIATYIYNTWEHKRDLELPEVRKALEKCAR